MDLVQVASSWLLVDEIEVVSELFEGNMSSKFHQRTISGVEVTLVCVRMQVSVHPGSSTEGPAHRCHNAYLRSAFASVFLEGSLLLWFGEVDVGD